VYEGVFPADDVAFGATNFPTMGDRVRRQAPGGSRLSLWVRRPSRRLPTRSRASRLKRRLPFSPLISITLLCFASCGKASCLHRAERAIGEGDDCGKGVVDVDCARAAVCPGRSGMKVLAMALTLSTSPTR
jgi:hypothetical protein